MDAPAQYRLFGYSIFAVFMLIEFLHFRLARRGDYHWPDAFASMGVAVGQTVATVLAGFALIHVYGWVYANRLFDIPMNSAWSWVALFFALEFMYYWFHRFAHEIRWLWASHGVHHSSPVMHFPAAVRLGWTGLISGFFLFWAVLVWIGFPAKSVLGLLALNLFFQFFLHTESIGKLGPLEWVFNTPSHHRVHHAINPEYLDKNYGGVLIVFDRLFGTFAEEKKGAKLHYGVIGREPTRNPFKIALGEWVRIGRDVARARSWREAWGYMFGPPGWKPDGQGQTTAAIRLAAGLPAR